MAGVSAAERNRGRTSDPRRPPPSVPETSRLLAFSDGVFALAATLLVVTLRVPESYADLRDALAGFPAFALAFAAIVSLWHVHRQFFARYPLGDVWTVVINSVLLFVVVLYVYPLKLMAAVVAERILGLPGTTEPVGPDEVRGLLVVFGAAVVATSLAFLALQLRAWQRRVDLALTAAERAQLAVDGAVYASVGVVAMGSMAAAAAGVGVGWGFPLWLYLVPSAIALAQPHVQARRHRRPIRPR